MTVYIIGAGLFGLLAGYAGFVIGAWYRDQLHSSAEQCLRPESFEYEMLFHEEGNKPIQAGKITHYRTRTGYVETNMN